MSGLINVEVDKMEAFGTYVADFASTVNTECQSLSAGASALSSGVSEEELTEIKNMVGQIEGIVQGASPVFQALSQAISAYAEYVREAQRILRGG